MPSSVSLLPDASHVAPLVFDMHSPGTPRWRPRVPIEWTVVASPDLLLSTIKCFLRILSFLLTNVPDEYKQHHAAPMRSPCEVSEVSSAGCAPHLESHIANIPTLPKTILKTTVSQVRESHFSGFAPGQECRHPRWMASKCVPGTQRSISTLQASSAISSLMQPPFWYDSILRHVNLMTLAISPIKKDGSAASELTPTLAMFFSEGALLSSRSTKPQFRSLNGFARVADVNRVTCWSRSTRKTEKDVLLPEADVLFERA